MQDSTLFQQIKPQFPEQEHLKCPRCESTNTKFCYYNNYNLSQPRHFCKNCRRYWTKGGALRNIPVGGGSRKNSKRPSTSAKRQPAISPADQHSGADGDPTRLDSDRRMLDISGSFSSLLASSGQFGNLLDPTRPGFAEELGGRKTAGEGEIGGAPENYLGVVENGWPDLAIYTPGSSYQ